MRLVLQVLHFGKFCSGRCFSSQIFVPKPSIQLITEMLLRISFKLSVPLLKELPTPTGQKLCVFRRSFLPPVLGKAQHTVGTQIFVE